MSAQTVAEARIHEADKDPEDAEQTSNELAALMSGVPTGRLSGPAPFSDGLTHLRIGGQ